MAHYAFLDSNSIVTNVIVGKDETESTPAGFDSWEEFYANEVGQNCKRTSDNAFPHPPFAISIIRNYISDLYI